MAARKSSRVNRKYKTKYRVTNSREYERGLRSRERHQRLVLRRGARSVDTTEQRPPRWPAALLESGNRDGVDVAHGLAPSAPTARGIPRLVVAVDGARPESAGPHHVVATEQRIDVPSPTRAHDGALDLIVDSKRLKISGAGEWHAHRHKNSKAPRQWRKLHVGVDDDGFIVAAKLTKSREDDPSTVPCVLVCSNRSTLRSDVSQPMGPTILSRCTSCSVRSAPRTSRS